MNEFLNNKIQLIYFQIISSLIFLSVTRSFPITNHQALLLLLPQDSTITGTPSIKADSLLKENTPVSSKIAGNDSIQKKNMSFTWHISKTMLNEFFYEDMGDLLQYIPGIFVKDLGRAGQELFLNYQGADSRQIIIFLDGRPMYNPIFGGIDLNVIPIRFAKALNIEPPASSDSIRPHSDLILIISENYEEDTPYSQVYYHKAPSGLSNVDIIFGQRISQKTNLHLGGCIKSFEGKNSDLQRFEQQNFRGKLQYLRSPNWYFEYLWIHNKMNRHTPGPMLENRQYATPGAIQKTSQLDHTVTVKGKPFKSRPFNFNATIFYTSINMRMSDDEYHIQSADPCQYAGCNLQMQNNILEREFFIGGSYIDERTDADKVGKHHHESGSFFIKHDYQWQNKFRLGVTGSYMWHRVHGSHFEVGISTYFLINKKLNLIMAAKQYVRYPTFTELYARTYIVGNPGLTSELHKKFIIGMDYQLCTNLYLKTDLYLKNLSHNIYYERLDMAPAIFVNRRGLQFLGGDLQMNWELLPKLKANIAMSGIDNAELYDQPKLSFISYLQYGDSFFHNDLRPTFRIEARYIGERKSAFIQPYFYTPIQAILEPVFLLNAHAILDLGNLKIFFLLENILDQKYQLIYGFPMNERTLHYGLRWEFWD